MKKILPFIALISSAIILCGCPYDSAYNLDEVPLHPIDESLLGCWSALIVKPGDDKHVKEEPVRVIFDKRTDMDYNIAITGHIEELRPYHVITVDSIKGIAYLSVIDGKQFINAFILGRVYIAEVKKDNEKLSILPLAEHFISKLIKSSKELRIAVVYHYKVRLTPRYDHFFCLRDLQKVN